MWDANVMRHQPNVISTGTTTPFVHVPNQNSSSVSDDYDAEAGAGAPSEEYVSIRGLDESSWINTMFFLPSPLLAMIGTSTLRAGTSNICTSAVLPARITITNTAWVALHASIIRHVDSANICDARLAGLAIWSQHLCWKAPAIVI